MKKSEKSDSEIVAKGENYEVKVIRTKNVDAEKKVKVKAKMRGGCFVLMEDCHGGNN